MALKIDIYIPGSVLTFEVGVSNVQNINVKYYFANVVHITIYFTDGTQERFYQNPCRLYVPAPP